VATRLYIPSFPIWANPYTAAPFWHASWEQVPSNMRRSQITSTSAPQGYGTVGGPFTESNATSGAVDVACVQLISQPLDGDQTITGTITGQVRASESNAAANAMTQLVAYVIAPDGTTRGVLYAGHTNALSSELATSLTNRTLPLAALSPASLSSVTALSGDRIVVEIGARKTEASTTSRNLSIGVGTDSASDLPADETTTTADNGWVEFSQNLVFWADAPRIGSLGLLGVGV